eukprot:IDg3808t1
MSYTLAGLLLLKNASSGSPLQSLTAPSVINSSGYCANCACSLDYCVLHMRPRVVLSSTLSRAIARSPHVNALFSYFFFSLVFFLNPRPKHQVKPCQGALPNSHFQANEALHSRRGKLQKLR